MRYVSSIKEITIEETRIKMALNMLKDQVPLETIARYTELPIKKVRELHCETTPF